MASSEAGSIRIPPPTNARRAASINLTKAILGLGITALPHAFAMLGILPAIAVLCLTVALTHVSCMGLANASIHTGALSYPQLVAQQLGGLGALTMQGALLVNCGGMLVAYLVVMRDLVHGAVHQFRGTTPQTLPAWLSTENAVLAVVVVGVLGPLVSFRCAAVHSHRRTHARQASPCSGGCKRVGAAGAGGMDAAHRRCSGDGGGTWHRAAAAVAARRRPGPLGAVEESDSSSAGAARGVHLSVQVCITRTDTLIMNIALYPTMHSFHPIISDLQPLTRGVIASVLAFALAFTSGLYVLLCIGSLMLFGPGVEANVLRSITPGTHHSGAHSCMHTATHTGTLAPMVGPTMASVMHYSVHSAFLVSVTTSFPLQMWPARVSLWQLVARDRPFAGAGYFATTYGLLLVAALLAAVCPSVWVALQWIGAWCALSKDRRFVTQHRCHRGHADCVCDPGRADGCTAGGGRATAGPRRGVGCMRYAWDVHNSERVAACS